MSNDRPSLLCAPLLFFASACTPPDTPPPVLAPQVGEVELTLDPDLQAKAQEALEATAKPGAAVVLDARTGAVLALVERPGRNKRPARSGYRPGSTLKPLVAAAAISEGELDPDEAIECSGKQCFATHGPHALTHALATSCNEYTRTIGARLGADRILSYARRLGLGSPTGLEIPESSGHAAEATDPDAALETALGYGSTRVTPVQLARVYAGLARGALVTVHLHADAEAAPPNPLALRGLEAVRNGLEAAVDDPEGTAHRAGFVPGRVAGKTGTMQAPGSDADDAWFAGYAPADDPEVVVVVLVEAGGFGGRAAAPVAAEILAGR